MNRDKAYDKLVTLTDLERAFEDIKAEHAIDTQNGGEDAEYDAYFDLACLDGRVQELIAKYASIKGSATTMDEDQRAETEYEKLQQLASKIGRHRFTDRNERFLQRHPEFVGWTPAQLRALAEGAENRTKRALEAVAVILEEPHTMDEIAGRLGRTTRTLSTYIQDAKVAISAASA